MARFDDPGSSGSTIVPESVLVRTPIAVQITPCTTQSRDTDRNKKWCPLLSSTVTPRSFRKWISHHLSYDPLPTLYLLAQERSAIQVRLEMICVRKSWTRRYLRQYEQSL
jgi:hypothetical protein